MSKEEFLKSCSKWKPKHEGQKDDLDDPLRKPLDSDKTRTHVELLYGKIVDRAREERSKKDKEREERELLEKKKLEEPPQKTLVRLIDERIAAKVTTTAMDEDLDDAALKEREENALQSAEVFVTSVGKSSSGNGGALGAGPGSAVKNQPKTNTNKQPQQKKKQQAKGAPAGKGHGKTHGKGRSKKWKPLLWGNNGPSQSKGKDKGNGKGKDKGKNKGDGKGGKGQKMWQPQKGKGKGKGQWSW